jgi:UDP-glucose 6-dehydrogenase
MQVPGPDGRKGYGGACFPKDTKAFSHFAEGQLTVLDAVIEENNIYRAMYELDDREKEQNVVYI